MNCDFVEFFFEFGYFFIGECCDIVNFFVFWVVWEVYIIGNYDNLFFCVWVVIVIEVFVGFENWFVEWCLFLVYKVLFFESVEYIGVFFNCCGVGIIIFWEWKNGFDIVVGLNFLLFLFFDCFIDLFGIFCVLYDFVIVILMVVVVIVKYGDLVGFFIVKFEE